MRYHNITKDDMLNGEGLRVSLWVSGCPHHCDECFNPETHKLTSGIPFTTQEIQEIDEQLNKDYVSGLSLLGGDPLHLSNRTEITLLCEHVKRQFPEKNIWCWTGYLFEDVKNLKIMDYLDVLVDGKFIKGLKDNNFHWRGSEQQVLWRKQNGVWVAREEDNRAFPIKGFESYLAFRDGRIFSTKTNSILQAEKNNSGYPMVMLYKNDGRRYNMLVHRIIADTFIPNESNLPCVNHKDEDKTNNNVSNLEWCTYEYNNNYGTARERMSNKMKGRKRPEQSKNCMKQFGHKVKQITMDGKVVSEYCSIREAGRVTGICSHSIYACCNGKRKTAGGYKWERVQVNGEWRVDADERTELEIRSTETGCGCR